MKAELFVNGMSCASCIEKVKDAFANHHAIKVDKVQLKAPQLTVSADEINLEDINALLAKQGNYSASLEAFASEVTGFPEIRTTPSLPEKSINTYFPLLLIILFISGVCTLVQFPFTEFSFTLWMRHFMAGFFLVFSFFKLLNLTGFASSYAMYDIVAAKWKPWGFIYPFAELALGLLYLTNLYPVLTNWATIVILGVSTIGVVESNLNKRKIKCACLGDVFNLPMSTVTIVEDLSMVIMAATMLIF